MKIAKWLIASYRMNFPTYGKNRPFNYKKSFSTQMYNVEDAASHGSVYQSKGIHTELDYTNPSPQENTFRTMKWPWDGLPKFTEEQLYNSLRGMAQQFGLTKRSLITDEYPENTQNTDPEINSRMYHAHKGLLDYFRQTEPNLKARDTGNFGSYGVDDMDGLFNPYILYSTEQDCLDYVNNHVHERRDPNTGQWKPLDFYASRHFEVRNANMNYYMYSGRQKYFIPYEILSHVERLKVGSKTYENQDREVDLIAFSTPLVQNLIMDNNGNWDGIEYARRQDVIEFPGGVIKPYTSYACSDELYTLAFWSTLLTRGIILWGGGIVGNDGTKFRFFPEFAIGTTTWTPTGGSEQPYVSGQNGAPVIDESGVNYTVPLMIDAAYCGWEDALEYTEYTHSLSYVPYTSSRKSFTPTPGLVGHNVNGFGPLNKNQISFKKALDQKCGIALFGEGPSGKGFFYYNGHLSAHEYEDDVTLVYQGQSINLGRVYGRQTAHAKI